MARRRKQVLSNLPRHSSLRDAELYFRIMATYMDQLRMLIKDLRKKIK